MKQQLTAWTSSKIRQEFVNFFKKQGHAVVSSSSLVPIDDPTLLFTNAGMVQFKDIFLGNITRPYTKAVSVQRCVRAGGKHNDLENVGYTKRHHTFFEMLGNFSFGDYFKKQAIKMAWQFLTTTLEIPSERLWITVFRDDKESESIWLNDVGIDPKRFSRCGEKDNFWAMGDIGPCGPCTEIFYDHGSSVEGGPPGSSTADGDRYTEIWNLVFMQYNRDISGKLYLLPKPCVDTGMGLERIAAVMQGVHDNYDVDIFQELLRNLGKLVHCDDYHATPMRVIADHIRSASFLITDGITPSNEGRGYVLRRIIRRAARYGFKLGQQSPFFYRLVSALVETMQDTYPQLTSSQTLIEQVIEQEEKQFSQTLSKGLKILDKILKETDAHHIDGQLMFQLYDTYGFPVDLTIDIAKERGLLWDYAGFELCMQKQKEQSQLHAHFNLDQIQQIHISGETQFTGYEKLTGQGKVISLLHDFKPMQLLKKDEKGIVILDKTPFYAESGGQVGDTGYLYFDQGSFRVQNTRKKGDVYLHQGYVVSGELSINNVIRAEVDATRHNIKSNHSATHLLHEALRRVLGEHVAQKGSLVEYKRLRFDFSYTQPLTEIQIHSIERLVNQQICANLSSITQSFSLEDAKQSGALALFSEKYMDEVRVVTIGNYSKEICGGTHVTQTGEIGLFKIISESACAAGIRRIEAVTGSEALRWVESLEHQMNQLTDILKIHKDQLTEKCVQLLEQNKQLNKELSVLKSKMASQKTEFLKSKAKKFVHGVMLIEQVESTDRETLRDMVEQLKQSLNPSVILLAGVVDEKVVLITSVEKSFFNYFKAPDLLKFVAEQVGGHGGGRADMAQGGGDRPQDLLTALESAQNWVIEKSQKPNGADKSCAQ